MQEKIITGLICTLCFTKHQHKEARAFTCRHVHCHRQKTWMKGGPPLTQSARHQLGQYVCFETGVFSGPLRVSMHMCRPVLWIREWARPWTACTVLRGKKSAAEAWQNFTLWSQQAPKPCIWSRVGPDLCRCFHWISCDTKTLGLIHSYLGLP